MSKDEGMSDKDIDDLRDALSGAVKEMAVEHFDDDIPQPKKKSRLKNPWWWAAAAIISLAVGQICGVLQQFAYHKIPEGAQGVDSYWADGDQVFEAYGHQLQLVKHGRHPSWVHIAAECQRCKLEGVEPTRAVQELSGRVRVLEGQLERQEKQLERLLNVFKSLGGDN